MKPIPCDHCEDGAPALYLLQDISTGDSTSFCADHFAMQCMGVAEAWAQEQMTKEGAKSDEQREVYNDPGPSPQINESEESASNGRGNVGIPDGAQDATPETANESAR